jgi:hypothetical protein
LIMQQLSGKIKNGIGSVTSTQLFLSNQTNGVSEMTKKIIPSSSKSIKICSVEDCESTVNAYEMCKKHRRRLRKHGDVFYHPPSPEERFWVKVRKTKTCWEWTSATLSSGYGIFSANRKVHLAHRYSYELLVAPIPEGLYLDHLCRVKHCVNPTHLEPVTNRENVMRGITGLFGKRTHCLHGHPFNEANTKIRKGKLGRICLECKRRNAREYARRKRKEKECKIGS